jgi:methyl-accepting chemotaxis protein
MKHTWSKNISLMSRGARYQIVVATSLVAVLPILAICFIALPESPLQAGTSLTTKVIIIVLISILAASGYTMLLKYPKNIMRLRHGLQKIAEGELPERITLLHSEDDIMAIENYLNTLLDELRKKVVLLQEQLQLTRKMHKALETQQKALLEAERHRVMIQSLGAACHHIGQPATLLCAHFQLLKRQALSPRELAEVEECAQAVDTIAEVIEKLRRVGAYRTVPYLVCDTSEHKQYGTVEILDIAARVGTSVDHHA